jgi:hypothetical protein
VNRLAAVTAWCGILQSNVYFCMTHMWSTDLLESVGENIDLNFVKKDLPKEKNAQFG